MVSEDLIQARLEIPCSQLGLEPPPANVHIRLAPRPNGWLIYLWNRDGVRDPLLAWFGRHLEVQAMPGSPAQPRVSVLEARDLPASWTPLVEDLGVDLMVVEPSGVLRLSLRGPRSSLQRFVDGLSSEAGGATVEEVGPAKAAEPLLTDRQREVLVHALSSGYFEVPRRIRLKELSAELGLSEGSLSELLRRAEGRVLYWFFEEGLDGQPHKERWAEKDEHERKEAEKEAEP